MVFNSNIFLFGFLPLTLVLFWLARTKTQRYVLLSLSGFIFYGYWNWKFCFLLLFSGLFSFFVALRIDANEEPSIRYRWVFTSVAIDLTILGIFKYYNFFADSLSAIVPSSLALPRLNVILPIGISFYTFHTISYVVDVYARRVGATANVFEYLTYVNLFSQLVAGPIVRFRQIEKDLEQIDGALPDEYISRGIGFFTVGLVKKVIVADQIAFFLNPALADVGRLSTSAAWVAAFGYTLQLYYDFSGYSDMAVGLGYMFGLRIPQNFNAPYQATGIADFWRRWHISLSSWLRDYLYIPLGGNRKGPTRTNVNLITTMLLGGLWHGANWTFIIWGAYHGLLLMMDRIVQPRIGCVPDFVKRVATFLLVVIGWVPFRSTTLAMADVWLGRMFSPSFGAEAPWQLAAWVAVGLIAVNTVPETWDWHFTTRPKWAAAYAWAFLLAYLFVNEGKSVFLYYQF